MITFFHENIAAKYNFNPKYTFIIPSDSQTLFIKTLESPHDIIWMISDGNKLIETLDDDISGIFYAYVLDIAYNMCKMSQLLLDLSSKYEISRIYANELYQRALHDNNEQVLNTIEIYNCSEEIKNIQMSYECPNCDEIFDTKEDLERHIGYQKN